MKKLPAVFYATYRGNKPVRERLKKLDAESRQIVGENMPLPSLVGRSEAAVLGYGQGLHEIRGYITNGRIALVLFSPIAGEMVLLHGFIRKAQKTPKSDLDLAIKRMKEYVS